MAGVIGYAVILTLIFIAQTLVHNKQEKFVKTLMSERNDIYIDVCKDNRAGDITVDKQWFETNVLDSFLLFICNVHFKNSTDLKKLSHYTGYDDHHVYFLLFFYMENVHEWDIIWDIEYKKLFYIILTHLENDKDFTRSFYIDAYYDEIKNATKD